MFCGCGLLPKHIFEKRQLPLSTLCRCRGESRGIGPLIHNLGARWRWVVNFMHWLLYPWGKTRWYPLNRRQDGPHWSRFVAEEKGAFASARNQSLDCWGCMLHAILTVLSWLLPSYSTCNKPKYFCYCYMQAPPPAVPFCTFMYEDSNSRWASLWVIFDFLWFQITCSLHRMPSELAFSIKLMC
jgi:hypothetical protein